MARTKANQALLSRFGNNVRRLRQAKGWSQTDLAAATNLELRQIGRIENGLVNTSLASAMAIAHALDTTVDQLAGA